MREMTRTAWLPGLIGLAIVAWFVADITRFFPNATGGLGYDYGLFFPWFVGGSFWEAVNGPWVPPEYLPSFCGGVPFLFNPQSVFWSLPQQLMTVLPPMASLIVAWVAFGLLGASGMYALLRRVFATSRTAALLGAALFLLNGFYTARMAIGHVTFHGVMLLPLIALLLFARRAGRTEAVAPALGAGLALAYLFYSGGTNTILPMGLGLCLLALLVAYLRRWHRGIFAVTLAAGLLCLALCAYKLLPALAYAGNVVRPVSLRMTGNLMVLMGAAAVALFVPQALAYLPPDKLVLDRVEFEYGVGLVPLLLIVAALWTVWRRGELARMVIRKRWPIVAAMTLLLALPILINWDALGLRWVVLHLPILKMMSVLLRFWFAYVPLLCVLSALLIDYLVPEPGRRSLWVGAAMALTLAQAASTDMTWYTSQSYDPSRLIAAQERVAHGGAVPPVERIADPWPGGRSNGTARNDALVDGISDVPCYEPMFGYRMEVFRQGRLAAGPALDVKSGLLNLKNPSCYTFPTENGCRPGDEFRAGQRAQADAFRHYRPFAYVRPLRQKVASAVSLIALVLSLVGLAGTGLLALRRRASGKESAAAAETKEKGRRSDP